MQATLKALEVVRKTRIEALAEVDHGHIEERRENSSHCF